MIEDAIRKITKKQPFFTSIVRGLEPVVEEDIPTLATDGEHLFYNPQFLKELKEDERAAVVLHETLHCAFAHMWRVGKRDHFKWNIATDYAINPMVNEVFILPKGTLLDSKYYGMSAEAIYDALPKNKLKLQEWCEKDHWDDKKGGNQGKGKGHPNQEGKKKGKSGKDGKDGKGESIVEKIKEAMGNGRQARREKKEAEWRKKMNNPLTKAKWKRLFRETFLDNYGNAPDSVKRVIEKQYYIPTIDWQSIVASILSEDTHDYSFNSPDRRYSGAEFVLPGMYSFDNLKDVVFAYDTSGSITDEDLHAFHRETLALFENFSNLTGWAAVCDAALHSFKDITANQDFRNFSFYGGGGTDFNPVFDEIKKRGMKPKALFYFTDTYGDFPDKEPAYPVFWLVRSRIGDKEYLSVPFGRVIRFLSKTK